MNSIFKIKSITVLVLALSIFSCNQKEEKIVVTADDFHSANDNVSKTMVHDIFSPPVASRVYAYSNIAAYEVMAQFDENYKSLAGQLNNLEEAPAPESDLIIPEAAAIVAFYDISTGLVFSEDRIGIKRDSLFNKWKNIDENAFKVSEAYGKRVATHIKDWMKQDNYAETRTMPKFSIHTDNESRWQPTPPSYMDGIEPHWMKIRPFVIDSANQFKPAPPPEFSMEEGSKFHNELMEVYNIREKIAANEENSEEMAIAKFWDCNPYVSILRGHLMFATKKITPGGHWMGIVKIACKKDNADFNKSVYAYSKTAIAIADGFISCWDEKYRSNLVRPETLINKYVDENWSSVLQTPPFPEYTSGHSVISGAAAIALTDIFGDGFAFEDDTEVDYGLPIRNFESFNAASREAANSRLYGGIHYRSAIEVGLVQGKGLGNFVVNKLEMAKKTQETKVASK
ncbi:vanadium-dependent haloperoxidase [Christiangramia sp. SM2212]|uniref:Vanadium-dependent haloperoxidase n=1 Tax=Christiangramia sediminicola TaxID=3073267 RepID=A0ABU1ENP9_9FLAO|nr:vanadium-dependent haloperoxidase [Christiangramia sp. SM2212]MDR5590014.1 vanadium-dependent haloperoxidase [Christiangramia sp. SM2212]